VALYGDTADQAYDSCYHQACDTLGNVNRTALDQNADAITWAVGLFALDTSAVNGNGSAKVRAQRRQAAKLNAQSVTATATQHDAAA
jgi:hypothetical protein